MRPIPPKNGRRIPFMRVNETKNIFFRKSRSPGAGFSVYMYAGDKSAGRKAPAAVTPHPSLSGNVKKFRSEAGRGKPQTFPAKSFQRVSRWKSVVGGGVAFEATEEECYFFTSSHVQSVYEHISCLLILSQGSALQHDRVLTTGERSAFFSRHGVGKASL